MLKKLPFAQLVLSFLVVGAIFAVTIMLFNSHPVYSCMPENVPLLNQYQYGSITFWEDGQLQSTLYYSLEEKPNENEKENRCEAGGWMVAPSVSGTIPDFRQGVSFALSYFGEEGVANLYLYIGSTLSSYRLKRLDETTWQIMEEYDSSPRFREGKRILEFGETSGEIPSLQDDLA